MVSWLKRGIEDYVSMHDEKNDIEFSDKFIDGLSKILLSD
jgi:hypothetical protein